MHRLRSFGQCDPDLLICTYAQVTKVSLYFFKIALKRFSSLGRPFNDPKMATADKSLFRSGTDIFLDSDVPTVGVPPSIREALPEYNAHHYFESWSNDILIDNGQPWFSLGLRSFRHAEML